MNTTGRLNEQAANVVENLAMRLAEKQGGVITANHLMPYLPLSFGLIEACLEDLVDGSAVIADRDGHWTQYRFPAYAETPPSTAPLQTAQCVACGADLPHPSAQVVCSQCFGALEAELNRLAESMGWPADAVYEHEILYLAAQRQGPVHAEDLASRSRYTLRNMRGKLDALSLAGMLRKDFDEKTGSVCYVFPAASYAKKQFRNNMAIIRSYPASMTEEVTLRVTRILFALGLLVLVLFVLAFLHVPFPLLTLVFLVGTPLIAVVIWRRRQRIDEE